MKTNRIRHSGGRTPLIIGALVLLALVGLGVAFGFDRLRDLWLDQSVIRAMDGQVEIQSGRMVKADVIAECLGIKPGVNLGTIDFAERREAILRKVPNLRELRIQRFLPDRVRITIEEREPIARLSVRGRKGDTGKVVDVDGVVFLCSRGTRLLPVLREASEPGTSIGHRLDGRARAALRFVAACQDPAFQELGILEADVAYPDWLFATINTGTSYTQLKLAWDGMDEPETPESHASLIRQLTHLRDAIRTRIGDGAVIWNATDFSYPGRIYADTKGKL